jgi:hypothetical protein
MVRTEQGSVGELGRHQGKFLVQRILAVLVLAGSTSAAGILGGAASPPPKLPSLTQLEAAISHAVSIKAAPNLLSTIPPLASLNSSDAKLPAFGAPCTTTTAASVPQDATQICQFGDTTAKRTIFVLGDSQASMWLVAISPIAKELQWRVVAVAHNGCPPWPDQAATEFDGDPSNGCQSYVSSALALEKSLRPQVVIPLGDGFHSGKGVTTSVNQADTAMRAFVKDVAPARVVFISPIPMYQRSFTSYTPSLCLVVAAKDIRTCEFPPKPMINRVMWEAEVTTSASEHMPKVNVTRLFCTTVRCALVVPDAGERLVYDDSTHANRFFMAWITSAFEHLLKPAL